MKKPSWVNISDDNYNSLIQDVANKPDVGALKNQRVGVKILDYTF